MGIMSMLDDESFFPAGSDKSFIEKLHAQHDGKSEKYGRLKLNPTMFSVTHYAGSVRNHTHEWTGGARAPWLTFGPLYVLVKRT